MADVPAVGVAQRGAAESRERLFLRRLAPPLRWLLVLFLLPRVNGSLSRRAARTELRRPHPPPAPGPPSAERDPAARLAEIARWIGTPDGRGRIVPQAPIPGVGQRVAVWEASGRLTTRDIRIGRMLGAGLAGTVYEVEGSDGSHFVEKHYGEVPGSGTKKLGRRLAAAVFSMFRQAPLSFRELPEAVVAIHLANRFIVAASAERFGSSITPPLLYTRYDARTGGYVQAFAHVEGRPLRPAAPELPLLGEAGVFRPIMRRWRDFLADELGFWGLARQVDPANVNACSNLWVTPAHHVVLLDLVPGVPGCLEPRYVWLGLRRGQFTPFADAIDFTRLARWVEAHPTGARHADLALLRFAVDRWQASEPRLVSSPLRPLRVLTDARVRALTRHALLTHIEVKGAVTSEQARAYRAALVATGRFPKLLRHSLLKLAPLAIHRALVDGAYARRLALRLPRVPYRVARAAVAGGSRLVRRLGALLSALARHLVSRELRMRTFRTRVGGWIEDERRLGRLTEHQAARLRSAAEEDEETADLAGLFIVHLMVSAVKHSLFGPSLVWIGLALATGDWWLALPAAIAPVLRVVAAVSMGFGRRPGLLALCALPDVGVLAAPLELARRQPELGTFFVRVLAQKAALSVPAFGQRGGLLEMAAVAAAETLLLAPARVLPWACLAGIFAALQSMWWMALGALSLYAAAVTGALITRPARRGTLAVQAEWRLGLPSSSP